MVIYIFACENEEMEDLPQENQIHTAQNQLEKPKEQLRVDLETWKLGN